MDKVIFDFINKYEDLIDGNEWKEIYERANRELSYSHVGDLTAILFNADIHPEDYLSELPRSFLWGQEICSFVIPASITHIGTCAFKYCTDLTSVVIPDSVTYIDYGAFAYCDSLTSITIPDSVTEINESAFIGCTSLREVEIGSSVTNIGVCAFSFCERLTSVTIPDSVTNIGYAAFRGCTSLTSVTIPNSVTYIGEAAFGNCGDKLIINYEGTKSQFRVLTKGVFKNTHFTAHCIDGDIIKRKR